MMNYFEWKNEIAKQYQDIYNSKMKLFGINPIVGNTNLEKNLISNNIFGTNDIILLKSICSNNEKTAIIIGFGSNNDLHFGHIILIKELLFYLNTINNAKLYFVNLEISDDLSFVTNVMNILRKNFKNTINYEIINYESNCILKLKNEIANNININTINRVMGWKNKNIYSYEQVVNMLSTFALGKIIEEKNQIIITDINQATYYTLLKTLENKLNIKIPCFCYHLLMPSLKSPLDRMSIKKPKSLIFLNDSNKIIKDKLLTAYTGLNSRHLTCSFLRVLDLTNNQKNVEKYINNCLKNNTQCQNCKKENIDLLINKIEKWRPNQ